jgi:hypothetical protein
MSTGSTFPESSGRPADAPIGFLPTDVEEIPLEDLPAALGRVEELSARIRLRIALASARGRPADEEDQELSVEEARRRFFPGYSKSGFYHAKLPFKRQRAGIGTRITCSTAGIRRFLAEQDARPVRTSSRTPVLPLASPWN